MAPEEIHVAKAAQMVLVTMGMKKTTMTTKRVEFGSNSLANLPINIRVFVAFCPLYYFHCYRQLLFFISDVRRTVEHYDSTTHPNQIVMGFYLRR